MRIMHEAEAESVEEDCVTVLQKRFQIVAEAINTILRDFREAVNLINMGESSILFDGRL